MAQDEEYGMPHKNNCSPSKQPHLFTTSGNLSYYLYNSSSVKPLFHSLTDLTKAVGLTPPYHRLPKGLRHSTVCIEVLRCQGQWWEP